LVQVRYRDAATGEIATVEPERPVERRRIRA
jgi:hypothetical protein